MIPLATQPKAVVQLSNTPLVLGSPPHNVSVGEEVEYLLVAELPVANLQNFKIRDELPAGVRCIEGQVINLGVAPYNLAGFAPGGIIPGICGNNGAVDFVEWNFGTQAITLGAPGTTFNFPATFIARVENSAITNEGAVLINGGVAVDPVTCAGGVGVCSVNDSLAAVSLDFSPVSIVVREPLIELTKSFAVTNSDAADVLTVTVTATNNGTAAAYNLRVLDDLVGSKLTYIPLSIGGTDPPDNVDTSIANRPIFSWNELDGALPNPEYQIAPAGVRSFTFEVRVDTAAQPLEILDNTIHAAWDSLPGQTTALNSTGLIGPDGSVLGLRNGDVLTPGITAPNDYETTASASTSVLPLIINKTDLGPAVVHTYRCAQKFPDRNRSAGRYHR